MAVVESDSPRGRAARAPRPPAASAADRVLRAGLLIAPLLAACEVAGHLAYHGVLNRQVGPLNADAEEGVWSWASTSATFAAAFAVALLAVVEPRHARRRLLLAGLLALFSLDDAVQLHEDYGEDFTQNVLDLPEQAAHAVWPALFLPLLALAMVLLLREARIAGGRPARLILLGAGLLATGVVLEATAAAVDADTWPGAIEIALEEGAELGGWTLIATALAAASLRAVRPLP
jgi:hypothetical protein